MRLLPNDREIGWTPYAWLIYLLIYVVEPVATRASAVAWAGHGAVVVTFLALYFRGWWLEGRRALPVIAAITALGVATSPFNPGGTVFFIYAAGFLGSVPPPAFAIRIQALILIALGLTVWLGDVPTRGWLPAVVFTVLIGAVNIHFGSVKRRNARLLLDQDELESMARSAERERIARDLHDLLGQTLSMITLKAELAGKLLERDPAQAAREIREVEDASRQALKEVRSAVRGYRSLGLAPEISRARLALSSAAVGLAVESGPHDLSTDAEGVAALALREAVTNVVRHAEATSCRVAYRQEGAWFHLVVEDDGRGPGQGEGSGLAGMRERAEALGGSLEVIDRASVDAARGTKGRGTRLELVLPSRPGRSRRVTGAVGRAS